MKAALGAFAAAALFLAGVVVGLGWGGGREAPAPEAIGLVDVADRGDGQARQDDGKGSRSGDVKLVPRDVEWGEYDDHGGGYEPNDDDSSGPGGGGSGSGDGTGTGDAPDGDGDSSGPGGGGGDNSGPGSDSGPGSTDSGSGSGSSGSGSSGSGSSGSGSSGSGSSGSG